MLGAGIMYTLTVTGTIARIDSVTSLDDLSRSPTSQLPTKSTLLTWVCFVLCQCQLEADDPYILQTKLLSTNYTRNRVEYCVVGVFPQLLMWSHLLIALLAKNEDVI